MAKRKFVDTSNENDEGLTAVEEDTNAAENETTKEVVEETAEKKRVCGQGKKSQN